MGKFWSRAAAATQTTKMSAAVNRRESIGPIPLVRSLSEGTVTLGELHSSLPIAGGNGRNRCHGLQLIQLAQYAFPIIFVLFGFNRG